MATAPTPNRLARRDWYWLTPLLAIILFVLMMTAVFLWLRAQDDEQRREALIRDTAWAQQTMRLRMQSTQDQLVALARRIGVDQVGEVGFQAEARDLLSDKPELVMVLLIDAERQARWVGSADAFDHSRFRLEGNKLRTPDAFWAYEQARETRRPVYSRPFAGGNQDSFLEMQTPIYQEGVFLGTVGGVYSVAGLLNHTVPDEFAKRYAVSIVDEAGQILANPPPAAASSARLRYEVPIDPPGRGLLLRAYAYHTSSELGKNLLLWVVAGLCAIILWSLLALWRHTQRRAQAEQALIAEMAFRHAMEKSMRTGLCAFDMSGSIVYVNPALCRMTGWQEDELRGKTAPFTPHPSPTEGKDIAQDLVQLGQSYGVPEADIQRKDGSLLSVRLDASPLIDQNGTQTGWMTAMTDITEAKRIREELAAAHKRFTKVLEGLDDAISVWAPHDEAGELLFANRTYRTLFGNLPGGHIELAARAGLNNGKPKDTAVECYSDTTNRWFNVRQRLIQWVDGRLVQMQVATDVTERRTAEEIARSHQEKFQLTSRLITMGEMASSLAHELNQPLTAIANYCMGNAARVRAGKATPEDLLPALEKTATQAERAGMIVRRIREFVKRSEPKKRRVTFAKIAEDAVGLSQIEAQKHGKHIRMEIEAQLPEIDVDPILIEQLLLNLLRNGIEAMQHTDEKEVILRALRGQDQLECAVIDRGHGIDPSIREKMFQPFYSTKGEGMGMGLNICRTIVEFHHGRLWAEDHPEGGTIFRFTLPMDTGPANPRPLTSTTEEHETH